MGFDPRSRARSDNQHSQRRRLMSSFDPRSRARSDSRSQLGSAAARKFRSALPCEERPVHAPELLDPIVKGVSIRAPVRGATNRQSLPQVRPGKLFRSALPCEERQSTLIDVPALVLTPVFRSALPCEERRRARDDNSATPDPEFRSALPCEERQDGDCRQSGREIDGRFDPRSRARSDRRDRTLCSVSTTVSIRAPVRGATLL